MLYFRGGALPNMYGLQDQFPSLIQAIHTQVPESEIISLEQILAPCWKFTVYVQN